MSVDADISASEDLFGLHVDDLQEDVVINGNRITGKLKFVENYTGFSSKPEEQSGNYLAIHAADSKSDADKITVELIGGTSGPRQLDSDGIIVLRIANKQQAVKVTSYKNDVVKDIAYFGLSGITLEAAAQG